MQIWLLLAQLTKRPVSIEIAKCDANAVFIRHAYFFDYNNLVFIANGSLADKIPTFGLFISSQRDKEDISYKKFGNPLGEIFGTKMPLFVVIRGGGLCLFCPSNNHYEYLASQPHTLQGRSGFSGGSGVCSLSEHRDIHLSFDSCQKPVRLCHIKMVE